MNDRATAIKVQEIGSFFVGGRIARLEGLPVRERVSAVGGPVYRDDPNGDVVAGQMYVQFVRLAQPRGPAPLLMWHGGGMTGASWEGTPDGRLGWQMFFLRAGFDTYVSDASGAPDGSSAITARTRCGALSADLSPKLPPWLCVSRMTPGSSRAISAS